MDMLERDRRRTLGRSNQHQSAIHGQYVSLEQSEHSLSRACPNRLWRGSRAETSETYPLTWMEAILDSSNVPSTAHSAAASKVDAADITDNVFCSKQLQPFVEAKSASLASSYYRGLDITQELQINTGLERCTFFINLNRANLWLVLRILFIVCLDFETLSLPFEGFSQIESAMQPQTTANKWLPHRLRINSGESPRLNSCSDAKSRLTWVDSSLTDSHHG
jgi:hypothetical protein